MEIRDYNGTGYWSSESVLKRYDTYVRHYNVLSPNDLTPLISKDRTSMRIYPIMNRVIECIEKKDMACIEIGIEFIEESSSFPFGMTLKYNTARALRRSSELLTDEQKERIRKRVVEMLCSGYLPREFRQYAKLARTIGLGHWQKKIERKKNFWVRHFYQIICHNYMDR